jgi:hypothetical protein
LKKEFAAKPVKNPRCALVSKILIKRTISLSETNRFMHIHCGAACDEQQTIPFITPRADKKAPGSPRWPRFFFVAARRAHLRSRRSQHFYMRINTPAQKNKLVVLVMGLVLWSGLTKSERDCWDRIAV